ncbi:hypothetical protein CHS0354_034526 [Potamilus streckersoni]|uniref:Ras-associating and dilute domain-containing protein n=1 Tax=Potamilus streckersoni TaxID=2493646 RepID=A0AAE0VUY5_9BIVA|nr:hypothetical protein CHS0354_034526 [Potamilus streckersoni]
MLSVKCEMSRQIARADWKRHSAPYDYVGDPSKLPNINMALTAHEKEYTVKKYAVPLRERRQKNSTLMIDMQQTVELSTDQFTPGVLKVFGATITPGVQYKSVLASCRSTALELVKQALERFGLPPSQYSRYVLCDVVGKLNDGATMETIEDGSKPDKFERIYSRVLSDKDKPLLLQKFWKPQDGFYRRYELHKRMVVRQEREEDDTMGLNRNARKILISKLRRGAIPLFDPGDANHMDGYFLETDDVMKKNSLNLTETTDTGTYALQDVKPDIITPLHTQRNEEERVPFKHPFFLTVRGYDVQRDKLIYVIKTKTFIVGNRYPQSGQYAVIKLYAEDINPCHCSFKVYKLRSSKKTPESITEHYNYFMEMDPVADSVLVNGKRVTSKILIQSGDMISFGKYYLFMYKDCSKGFDVPLKLPWLLISDKVAEQSDISSISGNDYVALGFLHRSDEDDGDAEGRDGDKISTDGSADISISERLSFAYSRDKEDELVKYISAIVNDVVSESSPKPYPLSTAFLYSMCIEYASRKFERKQLKNLFLRILFNVRENVAETAKTLSASKFAWTVPKTEEETEGVTSHCIYKLIVWISNCVQILLFLKNTFQLPELPPPDPQVSGSLGSKKDDPANSSLAQLTTGLEEIIMFCFQQSVYTITKALHPTLTAALENNPFTEIGEANCSLDHMIHLLTLLAQKTHCFMLHEEVTRQLFTYLFFFCSASVFNNLMNDATGPQYYNWSSGVRIRANLTVIEDWATRNGLEDEFGQTFERLLAASELLATSKNILLKYDWEKMTENFQPLNTSQLHKLLFSYQLGDKTVPPSWYPPKDQHDTANSEDCLFISLCSHPPFVLPFNCGLIDLIRTPEDPTFWNHLRRLRTLYGVAEDDSDSGFSISYTPRCPGNITKSELFDSLFKKSQADQEPTEADEKKSVIQKPSSETKVLDSHSENPSSKNENSISESPLAHVVERQKSRIPMRLSKHKGAQKSCTICGCPSDSQCQCHTAHSHGSLSEGRKEKKEHELIQQQQDQQTSHKANQNKKKQDDKLQNINCDSLVSNQTIENDNDVNVQNITSKEASKMILNRQSRTNRSFEKAVERGYESDTYPLKERINANGLLSFPRKSSKCTSDCRSNTFEIECDNVFEEDELIPKSDNIVATKYTSKPFNIKPSVEGKYVAKQVLLIPSKKDNKNGCIPTELYIEVNESILAAKKRQGCAINVLPLDEDNTGVDQSKDVQTENKVEGETQKKTTPCPLYSVQLHKNDKGLGLGLVDGLYTPLCLAGIYIRKILPDSPAAQARCLQVGDRILSVNGKSVIGADYQSTMKIIKSSGTALTLMVARGNPSIAKKISTSDG